MKASQKRWQFIWALGKKRFQGESKEDHPGREKHKSSETLEHLAAGNLWREEAAGNLWREKGGWRARCGCCLGMALDFIAP